MDNMSVVWPRSKLEKNEILLICPLSRATGSAISAGDPVQPRLHRGRQEIRSCRAAGAGFGARKPARVALRNHGAAGRGRSHIALCRAAREIFAMGARRLEALHRRPEENR